MRTVKGRICHAISFEIIGLVLVIPLGALAFGKPVNDMGVVALVSASIATCWNYVYNLGFDHAMLRATGDVRKSLLMRVFHAVLFETGLLIVLLPFIAWYFGISVIHALKMDVSFAVFYLVYAFIFNWVFDVVFPVPSAHRTARAGAD